jgi:hypothetical protein
MKESPGESWDFSYVAQKQAKNIPVGVSAHDYRS